DDFGEAVSFALRELIFAAFREAHPHLTSSDAGWQRVLAGRGMLGQMIECLLQTRNPNHTAAKELSEWLRLHHRHFFFFLTSPAAKRLYDLARLRGLAQHESVTEEQARQVYDEAVRLFVALLPATPSHGGKN